MSLFFRQLSDHAAPNAGTDEVSPTDIEESDDDAQEGNQMPEEEEDQGSDDDAQLEDEMEEEIKEEEPEEEMKEEDPEVPEQPEAERTVNPDQMETLPLDEMCVDSYWRVEQEVPHSQKELKEDLEETHAETEEAKEDSECKIVEDKKPEKKTKRQKKTKEDETRAVKDRGLEEEKTMPHVEDLVSDEEKKDAESRGAFKAIGDGIWDTKYYLVC